jgi:hypothetical protein
MHRIDLSASFLAMRTTFTLDDDAAELAQNYAKSRSLRLGKAVSELIRRASAPPMTLKKKGQLRVIPATPGAPKVSAQRVKDMIDALD